MYDGHCAVDSAQPVENLNVIAETEESSRKVDSLALQAQHMSLAIPVFFALAERFFHDRPEVEETADVKSYVAANGP
jgi:hypothetical protein